MSLKFHRCSQVGHLLAFAQAQTGDRALPLVTQTMHLLRTARLAALRKPRGGAVGAPPPAPPLLPPLPSSRRRAPKTPRTRTTACGLVVRLSPQLFEWRRSKSLRFPVLHRRQGSCEATALLA